MQTAEDTVKEAVKNFRKWLDNLKLYKQDPSCLLEKTKGCQILQIYTQENI